MLPEYSGVATANGYGATRRFVKEPKILSRCAGTHQTIAAAPSEVILIAHLPPILHSSTSGSGGKGSTGPGGAHVSPMAPSAMRLKNSRCTVVVPAKPGHDGQTFFGQLGIFHHRPQAGIGGHGFLQEDVFAGHGGAESVDVQGGRPDITPLSSTCL